MTNDVDIILQYLIQGDLLGFLVATFVTRLGQSFWAFISFMAAVPIYNRTQTLLYPAVVWLLLGGLFLTAMPAISPVAVLLIIIAIAVIVTKLFLGSD